MSSSESPTLPLHAAVRGGDRGEIGGISDQNLLRILTLCRGEPEMPARVGRYRMLSEIGRGGFGRVMLAEDDLLKRKVAVKILRRTGGVNANAALLAKTAFIEEARMVAMMNHPGIVPVFDLIESEDGGYCIISPFIEGMTLRAALQVRGFSLAESARMMVSLSEALQHAHKLGVVHRDVKPSNIVLGKGGEPMLLDFGLARFWSDLAGEGTGAGTPGYMSPEQARGEDHLVDGRADIFSLGAVFYEMLTGRPAFKARSLREHLDALARGGPVPPRQVVAAVPRELERICMHAVAMPVRSRYALATDMADDLRAWLDSEAATVEAALPKPKGEADGGKHATAPIEPPSAKPRVVPRGLRAFDHGDADFFLALVPGPRDRLGLPESLRFWKQRIESDDAGLAFRIGVMYGPSGCGKSSLARAGLLPRCAGHVQILLHEARDAGNAAHLARALQLKFPALEADHEPPAAMLHRLRRGGALREGQKLLLVVDQFEQWLRAGEADGGEAAELLAALRQCDGVRVQALLLVRDDFWRGVSRLLADADVELDSRNSLLVDLFEPSHAGMVLESFGRAYRCLPEDPAVPLPKEAGEFIRQSVQSLEEGRRVSPVRLAIFAEMFRAREWSLASLRRVGGVSGVAVTFLEESFCGPSARAPNRAHERAARQVLQLFVPEEGDVRGPARSQAAMLDVSGYAQQPRAFAEMLRVLDADLRLLTPVDTAETTDGQPSWQLTHDHMVPALREWLLARKTSTVRGRAEVSLSERAREWVQRPDAARLPGVWEWARLRFLTSRARWSPVEARWMAGGKKRAQGWAALLACAGLVSALILREWHGTGRGDDLLNRVISAPAEDVRAIISQGGKWMPWAHEALARAAREPLTTRAGLNARLALVSADPAHVPALAGALLESEAHDFGAITAALAGRAGLPMEPLRAAVADASQPNGRRLRAFAALAALEPESPVLKESVASSAHWLLTAVSDPAAWAVHLRPVRVALSPEIETLLARESSDGMAGNAAAALTGLHEDDPVGLLRVARLVPASSVPQLTRALWRHPSSPELLRRLDPPPLLKARRAAREAPPAGKAPEPKPLTKAEEAIYAGHANILLAAMALGVADIVWPCLTREADRTLRTFVFLNAAPAGVPPEPLARRLREEKDPGIRQALLLALCGYPPSALASAEQDQMLRWLRAAYTTDPDGGVHSSIATLLKRWSLHAELAALDQSLPRLSQPAPGMKWWITPSGVDMRVITMPDGRRVAVGSRELTVGEYVQFDVEPSLGEGSSAKGNPRVPVSEASWEDIARYCAWLSRLEQLPESRHCYEERDGQIEARADVFSADGFRMPTRSEWDEAAGASAGRMWDCGDSAKTVMSFAWLATNSGDVPNAAGSSLPNERGLWDVIGNALEWTHETFPQSGMNLSELPGGSYATGRYDLEGRRVSIGNRSFRKPQAGARISRSVPSSQGQ